jgi:hypothetical protein
MARAAGSALMTGFGAFGAVDAPRMPISADAEFIGWMASVFLCLLVLCSLAVLFRVPSKRVVAQKSTVRKCGRRRLRFARAPAGPMTPQARWLHMAGRGHKLRDFPTFGDNASILKAERAHDSDFYRTYLRHKISERNETFDMVPPLFLVTPPQPTNRGRAAHASAAASPFDDHDGSACDSACCRRPDPPERPDRPDRPERPGGGFYSDLEQAEIKKPKTRPHTGASPPKVHALRKRRKKPSEDDDCASQGDAQGLAPKKKRRRRSASKASKTKQAKAAKNRRDHQARQANKDARDQEAKRVRAIRACVKNENKPVTSPAELPKYRKALQDVYKKRRHGQAGVPAGSTRYGPAPPAPDFGDVSRLMSAAQEKLGDRNVATKLGCVTCGRMHLPTNRLEEHDLNFGHAKLLEADARDTDRGTARGELWDPSIIRGVGPPGHKIDLYGVDEFFQRFGEADAEEVLGDSAEHGLQAPDAEAEYVVNGAVVNVDYHVDSVQVLIDDCDMRGSTEDEAEVDDDDDDRVLSPNWKQNECDRVRQVLPNDDDGEEQHGKDDDAVDDALLVGRGPVCDDCWRGLERGNQAPDLSFAKIRHCPRLFVNSVLCVLTLMERTALATAVCATYFFALSRRTGNVIPGATHIKGAVTINVIEPVAKMIDGEDVPMALRKQRPSSMSGSSGGASRSRTCRTACQSASGCG